MKVLLVDDCDVGLLCFRVMLESHGYEVTATLEPKTALELIGKQTFDLLVTDVYMPGLSGIELAKTVRSRPQTAKLPILFISGHIYEPGLDEMVKQPRTGLLGKPLQMKELIETAGKLLQATPPPA